MWSDVWRVLEGSLTQLNLMYFLMGVISVVGLSVATTLMIRGGSLREDSRWARHVLRMRSALPAVVVLSLTTIVAGIQGGLEKPTHEALGLDFTRQVYEFEGLAVERFQDALRSPVLDAVLVAVYTVGAFLLYFVPFFLLVGMGRGRSAMRVALTMAGIWAVGVVAYTFIPVDEVWLASREAWYAGSGVEPILFERMPEYDSPAYMNSVNNNVPSLHTALSAGIALALWLARERWLAIPATIVASGIVLATVYLGIHWFVDVATGLLTMAAAAWLAHRKVPLEERRFSPLEWLRRKRAGAPEDPDAPGAEA